MLTDKEKEGCKTILTKLTEQDLLTLTDTVTNRIVSPENAREAMEAILSFSHTASQLLRRKKVKRDHIYQYLAENGIIEPTLSDKPTLIRRALLFWGSAQEDSCNVDAKLKKKLMQGSHGWIPSIYKKDSDVENDYQGEHLSECASLQSSPNVPVSSSAKNVDGQELASNFIPWFYKILNSFNTASDSASQEWGPQHFWNDAKSSILMLSGGQVLDECQGSLAVSDKLRELVCKEKLLFNANVAGARGQIDGYGLVKISVGGTVHRFSNCLGVFEQSFGLIRDPQLQNNWKIKFTDLKLEAQEQPLLDGQHRKAIT